LGRGGHAKLDGWIKPDHFLDESRAARLRVNVIRIVNSVPNILPRDVLISPGPDVWRWFTLSRVASAVVELEIRQGRAKAPVLFLGKERMAVRQGVNRSIFPRSERPPTSRDIN